MALATITRSHEQEMLNDITRILSELVSSARDAKIPVQTIPVKFIGNSSWKTWDLIAQVGKYASTYRIPQRTCGYETVNAAIRNFKVSRGDIDISDLAISKEGDCWMFNIKTSKES